MLPHRQSHACTLTNYNKFLLLLIIKTNITIQLLIILLKKIINIEKQVKTSLKKLSLKAKIYIIKRKQIFI